MWLHSLSAAGKAIVKELVKRVEAVGIKKISPLHATEQETLRYRLKRLLPQEDLLKTFEILASNPAPI